MARREVPGLDRDGVRLGLVVPHDAEARGPRLDPAPGPGGAFLTPTGWDIYGS
jgi:hypothetical protein